MTGRCSRLRCGVLLAVLVPAIFGARPAVASDTGSAYTPASISDDRGKSIRLDRPARRIVTLSPHLAEIAFAAGAGARVVGVSARSDFPDAASRLPAISDAGRLDLERIVALKPDLVLAWLSGNPARQVELLERRGMPVLATEPRELGDVARALRMVGVAAGTQESAEQAARDYEAAIRELAARYTRARTLRVFVEIWHEPLLTVNGTHLISDIVRLCGGTNVFGDAAMLTPTVSSEAVLAAAPDIVIMSSGMASVAERRAHWQRFGLLPAVQKDALVPLDPNVLERQGPRVVEAARAVCEGIDRARSARRAPS